MPIHAKPVRRLKAICGQNLPVQRAEAHFGASNAREFASWAPSQGSADSDLLPELGTLRNRTRDLGRNHGIASGALQTQIDNILGIGARLSCKPDWKALGWTKDQAEEWSGTTESEWREWSETTACDVSRQLTFRGLSTQATRAALVNGEALGLALWMPGRTDTKWATCLQMIESDRLSNPQDQMDSDRLRGGIERDAYGKPVAYHIRKAHPGEAWNMAAAGDMFLWERVEAETYWSRARVVHVHDKERAGQTRGKPLLSAVIGQFRMLDHFQRTTLQSAVVNAMVAAFIETPLGPEALNELMGGAHDLNDQGVVDYMAAQREMLAPLKGAAVLAMPPGSQMKPFIPGQPNDAFAPFVEACIRHIGVGLNMPYELILKDFSKTNYSSARAALLEAWRFFAGRRIWLTDTWLQPVYRLWLEEAVNSNAAMVQALNFYRQRYRYERSKWIWPGKGYINPVQEGEASVIRMDNNLSTLEDECAEQGKDWEEVLEQRAVEHARMKQLGLPVADKKAGAPQPLDQQQQGAVQ